MAWYGFENGGSEIILLSVYSFVYTNKYFNAAHASDVYIWRNMLKK